MIEISKTVSLENISGIAMLWIDNPPVNAIGCEVRKGLSDGIIQALQDDSIKSVVIICKGRTFCAGADIREFGKPPVEPHLPGVINLIEQSGKPVIAALHGSVLGGGLEIALGCHFRMALSSTRFGQTEVKMGLIPGAGGTQRLTRLIGPEKALSMIVSGQMVDTATALQYGIIDKMVEGGLAEAAQSFAQEVLDENKPLLRTGEMTKKIEPFRDDSRIFDDYRKKSAKRNRGFEAPEACIQAVEAAVNQPLKEGMAFERELFLKLRSGLQSAAQQHCFFAERQVSKIPDIPKDTPIMDIKRVGVIGAGTMGSGIAMCLVNAGIPVILVENQQEFLSRGLGAIKKNYEVSAARGKISAGEIEQRMGLISGSTDIADLAEVDMVIEAVFENMELKKEIFGKLDSICQPNAILATNTSYLDVNQIAAHTQRPESVLGLHFFTPANIMRLLEVVRGQRTAIPVLATCLALAKKIKKIAVLVGVCHGFAANRMYLQRKKQSDELILEGALPAQVDKVAYEFGFPMGPFALYDLSGNDLGWSRETSTGETIKEVLCEQGRLGLKAGAGFYNYQAGSRAPKPAPEIDQLIVEFSQKRGYTRREVADEDILQRLLYPIINEGAKILHEKIALRPSDLDVIWVNGYGWPRYWGGPMHYADQIGLDKILQALRGLEAVHGSDFTPAPLLEKLVEQGKNFSSLN